MDIKRHNVVPQYRAGGSTVLALELQEFFAVKI